jgi:hypothetical protein
MEAVMVGRAFEFLFLLALVAPPAAVIIGCSRWRGHADAFMASSTRSGLHRTREPDRSGHADGGVFPVRGISRAAQESAVSGSR